jgi:hypothetical protein
LHFAAVHRKLLERHSLREIGVDEDFAASIRDRTTGRKVSSDVRRTRLVSSSNTHISSSGRIRG